MFGLRARIVDTSQRLLDATAKADFKSLGHAAASIRKDAQASIKPGVGPSPPGEPPHTRKSRQLQRSIRYAVDKHGEWAVIGPSFDVVGTSAVAHEFGGLYKGQQFDERPIMGPALDRQSPRLGGHWKGTIG